MKNFLLRYFLFLAFALISTLSYGQEDQEVLKVAEVQPEPVGGLKAFYEYIEENLKYPESAKKNKIEGRVHVKFIVDTDGTLTNPQVIRGIDKECDAEAIRLIKSAPKWTPGKEGGKAVKVEVVRPITFKL